MTDTGSPRRPHYQEIADLEREMRAERLARSVETQRFVDLKAQDDIDAEGKSREGGSWIGPMLIIGVIAWISILHGCVMAQPIDASHLSKCGDVERMAATVRDYARSGDPVEVRGDCWSACTMLLALGRQVCTTPRSKWGFHGPSSRYEGIPLPGDRAAEVIDLIARHLPGPLAAQYRAAWSRTTDFHVVTGARLIRDGYLEECE